MRTSYASRIYFMVILLLVLPSIANAAEWKNELLMSWGTGSQPDADQRNTQLALDYNFYRVRRTQRTELSLGMGYTRLETDTMQQGSLYAYSIYPQLTLWPMNPALRNSYFFVRALGPTYLSENRLGTRKQSDHFTFQAQVGVGYRIPLPSSRAILIQMSWKHFSNANLFSDNDGFDFPFVLAFGLAY